MIRYWRSDMIRKFLLAVFCFLTCGIVMADEPGTQDQTGEKMAVWINAGMLSHHFERNKNYRENNSGFGAEVAFSETNSVTAGYFRNSDDVESNYLGWVWKPWTLGPARIGLVAALFDGYPRVNKGGWFPAAFPVVSLEYKAVGVNLIVIPTVGDRLHGALVAQIRLRIW